MAVSEQSAAPGSGLLVTFEGGEGSGKSTQVGRLQARLSGLGHDVVVTREPGGSPRAEAIRDVILSGRAKPYGLHAEALLFAAARADHVDRTIRPALARRAIVLCDRFGDSTIAYQGGEAGLPGTVLSALDGAATDGLRPAVTFVLDVPVEAGLARAHARLQRSGGAADRFEGEGRAYHDRIRAAFLRIAAAEPERCIVVSADRPEDSVADVIWAALIGRFPRLGTGRDGG